MPRSEKSPSLKGTPGLALDFLRRPSRALDALDAPGSRLGQTAAIYAAALAALILFYAFKPPGFPQLLQDTATERFDSRGLWFWSVVFSWTILHTVVIAGMIGWYARLLKEGWLPARLALAALSLFVPFILLVVYLGRKEAGSGPFLLAWALIVAAMRPNFSKVDRGQWRPLLALMLGTNSLVLASLPLSLLAAVLRASPLYYAVEIVRSLWTIALVAYGTSRLCGLPVARAAAAVVLALAFALVFFSSLVYFDLLPTSAVIGFVAV